MPDNAHSTNTMTTLGSAVNKPSQHYAFKGSELVAEGDRQTLALQLKRAGLEEALMRGEILVFDSTDGRQIDLHLMGTESEIARRYGSAELVSAPKGVAGDSSKRGRGRPKLGVVGKEVTLLPRHWEWLDTQRGGASATLRRLIDETRKAQVGVDAMRASQDRSNRFMSALAGDLPGFEEATRSLYAQDKNGFDKATSAWAADIRRVARSLSAEAFV